MTHAGRAATGNTGGKLLRKINEALDKLIQVPLAERDEQWAVTIGGVAYANELLSQGRRAKAGKVFAQTGVSK